jgi:hypothetical protein
MITAQGKTAIRRFLAGYQGTIADTLAVGLGAAAGESMQCEWARYPIGTVGTNVDNSQTVFKSSGVVGLSGTVYEIGLIQGAGGVPNDTIVSHFNDTEEAWTGNGYSFVTTNSRLDKGLKVTPNQAVTSFINPTDLSGFGPQDQAVLAAYSAATGTAKVTLNFANGSSVVYSFSLSVGYNIVKTIKSSATATGQVDWLGANKITVTSTSDTTFDLFKFAPVAALNEIIVARTVIATPFKTTTTLPLEIEYAIANEVA